MSRVSRAFSLLALPLPLSPGKGEGTERASPIIIMACANCLTSTLISVGGPLVHRGACCTCAHERTLGAHTRSDTRARSSPGAPLPLPWEAGRPELACEVGGSRALPRPGRGGGGTRTPKWSSSKTLKFILCACSSCAAKKARWEGGAGEAAGGVSSRSVSGADAVARRQWQCHV